MVLAIPLLPILYVQAKKVRKEVPNLPEAKSPKGYLKTTSEKTLKILAIGESTIAGVGVDFHENGFIGALAQEIANTKNISILWRVYAESGYTVKMVRKKIVPNIEETNADIIVIGLGANDAFTLNSPDLWMFQINVLIKTLKRKFPKTPIYFTNMPPIKEFPAFTTTMKFIIGNLVEIFGARLHRRIHKKRNVFYNNEIITLKSWQEKYNLERNVAVFFSDGVHPSKLTYQTWGKDMAQFIMNTKTFRE